MTEVLQNAFKLNESEIKTEYYKEGFFGKDVVKYHISEGVFASVMQDFPQLSRAVEAGLFTADKRNKSYSTTSKILNVRSSDKRIAGQKQFFSIDGSDKNDRTTLNDLLFSIKNVRAVAAKVNMSPKDLNFSIRHKNGDPNQVVNFIEVSPKVFGSNKAEVLKNLEIINEKVKIA